MSNEKRRGMLQLCRSSREGEALSTATVIDRTLPRALSANRRLLGGAIVLLLCCVIVFGIVFCGCNW